MKYHCHLSSNQWKAVYGFLHGFKGLHLEDEASIRRFVEGVFCILTTDSQWQRLPQEYGDWNNVYQRFCDWCDKGGVWYKMAYCFYEDPEMKNVLLNSTILREHACAAGTKKNRNKPSKNVGYSAHLWEVDQ